MATIEETLVVRLKADTNVTATFGSGSSCRIYPVIASQATTKPYAVYRRVQTEYDSGISDSERGGVATIRFTIYGNSFSNARNASDIIKVSLDGWSNTTTDPEVDMVLIKGYADIEDQPIEGSEQPVFGCELDFSVDFERS